MTVDIKDGTSDGFVLVEGCQLPTGLDDVESIGKECGRDTSQTGQEEILYVILIWFLECAEYGKIDKTTDTGFRSCCRQTFKQTLVTTYFFYVFASKIDIYQLVI